MRRNLKFFAVALLVGLLPAATAALAQSTCNLALNPPALILDANGGTGTIQVTAAPIQSGPVGGVSCPYTGYGSKPWIAVTGIITGSGLGPYEPLRHRARGHQVQHSSQQWPGPP